ncbi:tripartite tricarboxylate transporter TctB family protein [Natranaerofaba carboxydovora]|uniref:tripartite tricarboxylate transporter TctB family protein n=1 Tax=Natranaerofaba carboxydovora TaxID=2742683 RepID=UPI001F12A820|nr:tripartite tricarboxylate transporter TctB family protein [Natranaerofaba carboxydovora]UMZ74289.1 Tripartite tricarboxylate transporter TctB family protein [Natranaerofaba carboxydovora]
MVKDRDIVSGIILLVASIVGHYFTSQLGDVAATALSPGSFPAFIFTVMGLCGLIIIIGRVKDLKTKEDDEIKKLPAVKWATVIAYTIVFAIYVILVSNVGFLHSTLIFLFLSLLVLGERRPVVLIAVPIVSSFGIHFIFTEIFRIVLP